MNEQKYYKLLELSEIFKTEKNTIRARVKNLQLKNPTENIYTIKGNKKEWNITPIGFKLLESDIKENPLKIHRNKSTNNNNFNTNTKIKQPKKGVIKNNSNVELTELKKENEILKRKLFKAKQKVKRLKKENENNLITIDYLRNQNDKLINSLNNTLVDTNKALKDSIQVNQNEQKLKLLENTKEINKPAAKPKIGIIEGTILLVYNKFFGNK